MIRIVLTLVVSIVLFGCASNNPNRGEGHDFHPSDTQAERKPGIIETRNTNESNEYDMVFVEFNDQGLLHSEKLKDLALEHLDKVADKNSIVIIFTHGWHHNAHPNSDNVKDFQALLSDLSTDLKETDDPRNVIGVYIGWRGDATLGPGHKHLDFYDRKQSAHRVGYGATPLFLEIEKIVQKNEANLITIGHSFGAAVTYSALAPILQSRYLDTREGENFVEGFGNLVLLVNPAFEAIRHLPLFHLTQDDCRPYKKNQPVRLMIVTSGSDFAVRWIFSPAKRLINLTDRHQKDKSYLACGPGDSPREKLYNEDFAARTSPGNMAPTTTHCLTMQDGRYILKHKNIVKEYNPYMTLMTSGKLIPNHNDIWKDDFKKFVSIVVSNKLYDRAEVIHIDKNKLLIDRCDP